MISIMSNLYNMIFFSWKEEERIRQLSYEKRKKYQDEQVRKKKFLFGTSYIRTN